MEQNAELRTEHPWQLTLSAFLKKVAAEYDFELCGLPVRGPQGQPVHLPYLKNRLTGQLVHLPGNLQLEDQLDPYVTGSLCRRIRIPPEDFGLMPEEPYEDGD